MRSIFRDTPLTLTTLPLNTSPPPPRHLLAPHSPIFRRHQCSLVCSVVWHWGFINLFIVKKRTMRLLRMLLEFKRTCQLFHVLRSRDIKLSRQEFGQLSKMVNDSLSFCFLPSDPLLLGVYDITDFVVNHPGGSEKVQLAAGGKLEPYWNLYRYRSSDH